MARKRVLESGVKLRRGGAAFAFMRVENVEPGLIVVGFTRRSDDADI